MEFSCFNIYLNLYLLELCWYVYFLEISGLYIHESHSGIIFACQIFCRSDKLLPTFCWQVTVNKGTALLSTVNRYIFPELALQHVSLALRGEVGWEVVGPIPDMGWRIRKRFYQLKCKSRPKEELIASWTDYGPDKYLEDRDMHAVFKSFNQMQVQFLIMSVFTHWSLRFSWKVFMNRCHIEKSNVWFKSLCLRLE